MEETSNRSNLLEALDFKMFLKTFVIVISKFQEKIMSKRKKVV